MRSWTTLRVTSSPVETVTPDTTLVSGLVPHSTTLDTLLRGHGVADDAAMSVVTAARQVFDPRGLANPGKVIPAPGRCVEPGGGRKLPLGH